jgi:YbgC/YbaW family acyl-CoA thioester hydrolase
MGFDRRITVRFEDVDFARAVYFPKIFGYCHNVFEDFFRDEVKVPYAEMLKTRNVAFPSVHAEADFHGPMRFGDVLRVTLDTLAVGDSSIRCRYAFRREGEHRVLAVAVVVTAAIDLERFEKTAVPPDVRAAFERHRVPSED